MCGGRRQSRFYLRLWGAGRDAILLALLRFRPGGLWRESSSGYWTLSGWEHSPLFSLARCVLWILVEQHTVSSRWPAAVHISTKVRMSRRSKCRICDAFRVQPKANLLWIILRHRQRPWYNLRLMAVTPSSLILIRVVFSRRLQPLKIRKMKRLLRVRNKLALFEIKHVEVI